MRAYERLLRYTRFPTASDESKDCCPSTETQSVFAEYLASELAEMGIEDVTVDDNGYVYASIPATTVEGTFTPTIGFIAHLDVSDEVPCEPINARTLLYEGGDISLSRDAHTVLSENDYECLRHYRGKHLVVTDGTTLLGADDKAGVAEIMTMAELLVTNPDIPHGEIKIAFTPDEEIGRGADLFNLQEFGAHFAYTVDGSAFGEVSYENFNATSATVEITGNSIHPGDAKNSMINAQEIAMRFHAMLPAVERPEHTEGYEGFYHLTDMEGQVEHATLHYILRDHDGNLLQQREATMERAAAYLNAQYGAGTVRVTLSESYRNMAEVILPHAHLIDNAKEAVRRAGGTPFDAPIRGGTDGARLSFMGLPCPNLGTGSHNHHGRFEFACVEEMDACVDMLVNIAVLYAEQTDVEQKNEF